MDERLRGRLERIQLVSALGMLALGLGLGALLPTEFRRLAPELVVLGIALHAWGMFNHRRLEKDAFGRPILWAEALYWLCWLLLLAVVAYLT